jgi:hypothetical protein
MSARQAIFGWRFVNGELRFARDRVAAATGEEQ